MGRTALTSHVKGKKHLEILIVPFSFGQYKTVIYFDF
jgi:hypothetical protein